MRVALGMPFWGSDPLRKRNFEFCWDKLNKMYTWWDASWRIPLSCETRGGARNHLVSSMLAADVIVLCDADTYPSVEGLEAAISSAYADGGLHFAYDQYRYLNPESSDRVIAGAQPDGLDCDMIGPGSYGGVMAIRPEQWFEAGGSPSLSGWGFQYEDIIFSIQSRTLLRPDTWHPGWLTHLYHPSAVDVLSVSYQRNLAECRRYESVSGEPKAVRELIDERNRL